MKQYLEVLAKILEKGEKRVNRTEINTLALFGCQMKFNLAESFPLLTTKKFNFKLIVNEL
ncbi:MAG: hypothetical protein I3273_00115 [Candidatus Moeniiplasma glomeromycotorum]|nr:hypothetical protein [Candidatus Moeniiplasma glomeromycotorum]MCE8167466.1 hypothetical protein [Candidatus Moeniiplasma glomeromycotorum]MCE8168520.1 hypothetical protein [Candidatus Moeniiplasma glomeromycotorum]